MTSSRDIKISFIMHALVIFANSFESLNIRKVSAQQRRTLHSPFIAASRRYHGARAHRLNTIKTRQPNKEAALRLFFISNKSYLCLLLFVNTDDGVT